MYASLLGISGALYLSVFEQPARRVFFSILLEVGEVIQSSSSELQKAKRGLAKFLREEHGLVGVGLSLGSAGRPEIVVFVAEATSPVLAKVPTEWQGLAVRTEVSGFPRKY